MSPRNQRLLRPASLLLLVASGVCTACGKTNDPTSTDTTGAGGNGGNANNAGNAGTGSGSTGDAFTTTVGVTTAGVVGSGGGTTTGSGGSGGSGGDSSCAPAERLIEGCYSMDAGGAGEGGLAGAAGAGSIDPCWSEDAPRHCDASFEGELRQVGRRIDASWCDNTLFGDLTNPSVDSRQWLVIDSGDAALRVAIGGPSGELDVEVGDTVRAELRRGYYFEDFDWGSRLTLTKNDVLLAVLNDGFPVDDVDQYGDLSLSWGAKLCERPYDGACTFIAHNLDLVWEEDGGVSVAPYSSQQLGPFEIRTEGNFIVNGGGGFCDSGNRSEYLIARVKP